MCHTHLAASSIKTLESAPFHLGSLSGKSCPMSGIPAMVKAQKDKTYTRVLEVSAV